MNTKDLTKSIKNQTTKHGFSLVGITNPHNIKNNFLDNWLNEGKHATMYWMAKRKKERKNIFEYFPEVKSVISLGYNYYTGENNLKSDSLKISNYSWGKDYHLVLKEKMYNIITFIKNYYPDLKYRVCVDTSPILEKYWGQKAGLGWIGKHTNLINDKLGSWFFLGEILLDIELNYDLPYNKDLCGTCTKCIEECPTQALEEYSLDSNKCISYLTIEHRGDLPENLKDHLNNWIYGCDICQQVCPWNIKFSEKSNEEDFKMKIELKKMNKDKWAKLTRDNYIKVFSKSAIKRTKYEGIKRNIKLNLNKK